MIDFDFGDVVLVPIPFTDQSSIKKRPAVVVSSTTYNRDRPDIIIHGSHEPNCCPFTNRDLSRERLESCRAVKTFHAYQESAHKFEKNNFLTVSKPNIRFLRFLALVSDEHIPLFSRILPGY